MCARQFDSTSATLLARIQSGETQSWDRLTRLYGPLIRHWCKRWGIPEPELEDLVQETWVAVGPTLAGYRSSADHSFRAWLRGVTHHKAQDWHRRRSRQVADASGGTVMLQVLNQIQLDQAADDPDDPEDQTEKQALYGRALLEIRAEFENRTWLIFLAVTIDGKPVAEVAKEYSLSPAGVRKIKSRVLHRLRQVLGDLID